MVLPVAAHGQNGAVSIRIPAKPLAEALIDFALQAHLSIGDSGVDFGGALSNPLDGTFASDVALARLVASTGYGFEFLDANTVRILPETRAASAVPAVEMVLVTATRREEIAQRIPYSIVATSGEQIAESGVQTARELAGQVAGMTATNLGPGQDKLFVRGMTDSVLPGLSESMVGLYLDETRIADDAPDPDLRLIDVDRVEVLRGPQGTLYGAGSLGGLVRIVTNKPVLDRFESAGQISSSATENGAGSASADAMLNLPLVPDVLGLRLVGYFDRMGGYVDDIRLHHDNANSIGTGGGRAALAWRHGNRWTVSANLAYQQIRADDSQYYIAGLPVFTRDNYLMEPHADNFLEASFTINGSLGWAELVSATGMVDRRLDDRYDATLAWSALTSFPQSPSAFVVARQIRAYTHETRLVSTGDGHLKWLVGLYLSHRDEDFQSDLSGFDAAGTPVSARAEAREDRANEAAIFGEATYAFTDRLSVTVGGRGFVSSRNVSAAVTAMNLPGATNFRGANNQPGFTPEIVLAYHPAPNTTLYARYAQGYRLGGINVDGPAGAVNESDDSADRANVFDSDRLTDYETGVKWSGFRDRLVANGAIYFTVWRNVQTDQIAPNGAYFTVNAGTVRDSGAELDIAAEPFRNLALSANAFWNNAALSDINPLIVGIEAVLPGAPNLSLGMSARYNIPMGAGWDGYVASSYNFVGRSHLGFGENTPPMGGNHLTNVRIGIERNGWTLALFADNLFDDRSNSFAFGNPFNPGRQITPPRPRTIGLSLSVN